MRFLSALAAPVFPLVALLCCFLVELLKPGLGITAALQAVHVSCSTQPLVPSFYVHFGFPHREWRVSRASACHLDRR